MATPRQFAENMRRRGRNVERNAPAGQRRVALAIDAAVVLATPVDTGRARSNWLVATGAPADGVRETYGQGAGQRAISEGRAVIERHIQGPIHITNNLPYIVRLNQGSSRQAPAGFVEKSVQVGMAVAHGLRVLDDKPGGR